MILPELPENSRVWIFGAAQLLEATHLDLLKTQMDKFVSDWSAHGAQLSAGYSILHDSILIVAVDENVAPPTGCSIDKVFKLLGNFPVDFLQRMLVWQPFCNTSKVFTLAQVKESVQSKILDGETIVINTMVTNLRDVRERLYIPFKDSWAFGKLQS